MVIKALCQSFTFDFQAGPLDPLMHESYAIQTGSLIMQPNNKLPMRAYSREFISQTLSKTSSSVDISFTRFKKSDISKSNMSHEEESSKDEYEDYLLKKNIGLNKLYHQ